MKNNQPILILLVVLIAAFAAGIGRLFDLRFKAGDIYPPYSSLRADPLGAKVFHDSLVNFHQLQVTRNYRAFPRFHDSRDMAVFILGVPPYALKRVEETEVRELEALTMGAGRLVITLLPGVMDPPKGIMKENPTDPKKRGQADKPDGKEKPVPDSGAKKRRDPGGQKDFQLQKRWVSLADRWGFGLGKAEPPRAPDGSCPMTAMWNDPAGGRTRTLSWHTPLIFEKLNKTWRVLAKRDGHPVIIERKVGRGSVALCADSYLFSNEAMALEPHPEVLAYLVGGCPRIVFDEAHLGIEESLGIASLARKYHLHGLVAGFILLALLFTWKNAVTLVPRRDEEGKGQLHLFAGGKDSTAGLINLLRRNVAAGDVLKVCFEEWKTALGHVRRIPPEDMARIEQILATEQQPLHQRNPVADYNAIVKILAERKFQWNKQTPTS